MEWTKPAFIEIKMDAEIGSYQIDEEGWAPATAVAERDGTAHRRDDEAQVRGET
jgi:hypothetical protein